MYLSYLIFSSIFFHFSYSLLKHKKNYSPRGALLISKELSTKLPKLKRNKMEIYNDILNAVANEVTDGQAKPTRVKLYSNPSYDKLVRYLTELENKNLIIKDPLTITEKGRDFLQDYDRIANFVLEMGIKYFGSENSVNGDEK